MQALIEDGTYQAILDKWGVASGADHHLRDQQALTDGGARPG